MTKARVQKWGNSLGVRIPKAMADELALADGADVELILSHGEIALRPVRPKHKRYKLSELLADFDPKKHRADEESWDLVPAGKEII